MIFVITSNLLVAQGNGRGNRNGNATGNNGNGNGNIDPSNVFVGTDAGTNNTSGLNNVFVGASAGLNNTTGNGNVYIGNRAGETIQGDNKLFIHNDGSEIPLIYGDFATDQLGVNTNIIPDGYNFAVGGSASIDGSVFANGGIFEALDTEAATNATYYKDWGKYSMALSAGKIASTDEEGYQKRKLTFSDFPATATLPEGAELSVANGEKPFFYVSSFDKETRFFVSDPKGDEILKTGNFTPDNSNNPTDNDIKWLHMVQPDSRMVIGSWGGYLLDQGHKLVVKDGTAMIENAIYTNGRIAIGTTEEDPGYALTVKGKVHVQEVKVDLLGVLAPDYVFYEDYKLKTLKEVEDYIDQEGHLPNIPSASEMEAQGVNLKEMNMKLLEKVEELTLYTIAQEKAIKEQKEANDALEKRLQKLEKLLQK
ncbi:hypothetical protein [Aquimarina rubra]|uniref:TMF family protein n=1 Tax=Aquimarina rubra TaxID=1920033 RepID=A0ABW5LAE4_9FLAO